MPGGDVEIEITDTSGVTIRRPPQFQNLEVVIPLNDSRTGKVEFPIEDTFSFGDSAIQLVKHPFKYRIKVRYRDNLLFHGPILKPLVKLAENIVEVNFHDPTIYLKKHFIHTGDEAMEDGVTQDREGFIKLIGAAYLTAGEIADGVVPPGIVNGSLSGTLSPGVGVKKIERGTNVWDEAKALADRQLGPDFEFEPIDEQYDPDNNWSPGVMCQVNTWNRKGTDRTSRVFHYGWGQDNLENFEYAPDGESIRNKVNSVSENKSSTSKVAASQQDVGILESWEASSQEGTDEDLLEVESKAFAKAYGVVPEFFTITLRPEVPGFQSSVAGTPWKYYDGYKEGDTIYVQARRGRFEADLSGRVTSVTLSQRDASESVVANADCVPTILTDEDIVSEG